MKKILAFVLFVVLAACSPSSRVEKAVRSVSMADMQEWVTFITSDECRGRLTGDAGYDLAAAYVIDLFTEWGLTPAGDNGTYMQSFPRSYVSIKDGGYVTLALPDGTFYNCEFPDDYMAGGCSDAGEVSGVEIVYAGYGATEPSLGYDDYENIDVKGKVVLVDHGVPYRGNDPALLDKWGSPSSVAYKVNNAIAHGAAAVLQIGTSANPNCWWRAGTLYSMIGKDAANTIFNASGRYYEGYVDTAADTYKPVSFATGVKADIRSISEYHPEGQGHNIVAVIPGNDSVLKDETVILGAHLDHVGAMPGVIPGAVDDAGGCAVVMATAKGLVSSGFKPDRTIMFVLFAGEEVGLVGSDYFARNPLVDMDKVFAYINIDPFGVGDRFTFYTKESNAGLFRYAEEANTRFTEREMTLSTAPDFFHGRPRTDGQMLSLYNLPVAAFYGDGGEYPPYHHPEDTIEWLNFDMMSDAAKVMIGTLSSMSLK